MKRTMEIKMIVESSRRLCSSTRRSDRFSRTGMTRSAVTGGGQYVIPRGPHVKEYKHGEGEGEEFDRAVTDYLR